jgi:hypothetical protein
MYLKFFIVGLFFFLGFGVFMVLAQKDNKIKPVESESEKQKRMFDVLSEQAIFSRLSSVKVETDDGFCILAVRKMIIWINSPTDDSPSARIKKEMVQIELQAKRMPMARNLGNNRIQIGDKLFNLYRDTCIDKSECVIVAISVSEFNDLKDNSLVTLSNGNMDANMLKELYKNGEPEEVYGAKFGRLDKKMIDKFSIVEINKP